MALHEEAVRILASALVDLGLLAGSPAEVIERGTYRKFFMHRTGHWLGMDVHDVGRYRTRDDWRILEPGMVFTVEPGLYYAERGYGVRIEDTVYCDASGFRSLTPFSKNLVLPVRR